MPNDKMISIIRSNYELLPVLNRFGLKLGFKDKTVKEICEENYINPDFFLAILKLAISGITGPTTARCEIVPPL